jgi:GNAT superfamily N-acetyltransferase
VESEPAVEIRPARDDEHRAVAALRWEWTVGDAERRAGEREEFLDRAAEWARHNTGSHTCFVAVRDGLVLGMAWLAVAPRVPSPNRFVRANGDVQSVYVAPAERGCGLGSRLVAAILARATDLGLERVTVHSSEVGLRTYEGAGFASSPLLLDFTVRATSDLRDNTIGIEGE